MILCGERLGTRLEPLQFKEVQPTVIPLLSYGVPHGENVEQVTAHIPTLLLS